MPAASLSTNCLPFWPKFTVKTYDLVGGKTLDPGEGDEAVQVAWKVALRKNPSGSFSTRWFSSIQGPSVPSTPSRQSGS